MKFRKNIIEGTVVTLIGFFILIISVFFVPKNPINLGMSIKFLIGAGFLPAICGGLLIYLGITLIIQRKDGFYLISSIKSITKNPEIRRMIVLFGIFFVYILIIGKVSFLFATYLYFCSFFTYVYLKNYKLISILKMLFLSLIFTVLIVYVFPLSLDIMLP